jgi:tellurite resistance protein TehA-like permease
MSVDAAGGVSSPQSARAGGPAPTAHWLATMHPASFAMAMATGIVSIASHLGGMPALAWLLLWLNVVVYAGLWVATLARGIRFASRVRADISHHGRSPGFFTTVAATSVLGSQAIVIAGSWTAAAGLWFLATALWAACTYTILTALTVKPEKPSLTEGLNGGWLLSVVAAQSVSVLGVQVAGGFGLSAPQVLFFSLVMWLGGGMLYIWIIAPIFYRYTFLPLSSADLAPPYWINMGAVAISTLAGTLLVETAPRMPLLQELLPFLKGLTLMFWATATWWIPMLLILGAWRHVYMRLPLRYDPLYWGAVFSLGMYSVCTLRLAGIVDAPYLMTLSRAFLVIALAAWTTVMIGFVRRSTADRRNDGARARRRPSPARTHDS